MRKKFVAGNWKMNLNKAEAITLAREVSGATWSGEIDVAMCPPAVYLDAVAGVLAGTHVSLGAQNMYFEDSGAFTGEISGGMLRDIGCRWVILGHSERRHVLGETDEFINRKVHAAYQVGLEPILCVGETLEQREAGRTVEVVRGQTTASLAGVTKEQAQQTVIAYEPVWAIGTGKVATPAQAEEVHADLRDLLQGLFGKEVAEQMRIQYGGSVKPDNAAELLTQPNIDGALVGGASLKTEAFLGIIEAA